MTCIQFIPSSSSFDSSSNNNNNDDDELEDERRRMKKAHSIKGRVVVGYLSGHISVSALIPTHNPPSSSIEDESNVDQKEELALNILCTFSAHSRPVTCLTFIGNDQVFSYLRYFLL